MLGEIRGENIWCTQGFGKGGGSIIWVVVNKQISFNKFQSNILKTMPMSVCESAWLMWPF